MQLRTAVAAGASNDPRGLPFQHRPTLSPLKSFSAMVDLLVGSWRLANNRGLRPLLILGPLHRGRARLRDSRRFGHAIRCFRSFGPLNSAGEGWRIIGIDRECFLCGGAGQSGGLRCQKCDGEGWYDSTTNGAEPGA